MPVTQWEYNNLLRLDCNPLGPPAEEWRRELHDRSAGMVSLYMSLLLCMLGSPWSIARAPSLPCKALVPQINGSWSCASV